MGWELGDCDYMSNRMCTLHDSTGPLVIAIQSLTHLVPHEKRGNQHMYILREPARHNNVKGGGDHHRGFILDGSRSRVNLTCN